MIVAAMLMDMSDPAVPIAMAIDMTMSGTFVFSVPDFSTDEPSPSQAPFTTTGTHTLILVATDETQYMYIGNSMQGYDFEEMTGNTVSWTANFTAVP